MAHIFLSYSSKHRDETSRLAALLEAEGYAVWWDIALESWGEYRQQITAALEEAPVVVVLWSEGAANSQWVYSEATRALAAKKLVNARLPAFPFSGVPQPFDACHVDTLDFGEPHRLLKSIRGAWNGKPLALKKPLHEHYRETFGPELFATKRATLGEGEREISPSELLQAKFETVAYIDATGRLEDMLAWCRTKERATAGRLLHGPGGLGKTRLMIETARRLRAEDWLAGFIDLPKHPEDLQEINQREQALEQAFAFGDEPGVLLAVDYAEGRQGEVETLARLLRNRARDAGRSVRVVLLARSNGWWRDLYERNDDVRGLFRSSGTPLGDTIPLDTIPAGENRRAVFESTVAAFKPIMAGMAAAGQFPGWDGAPPSAARLKRLMEDRAFARPLAIQMEAMLYLASAAPMDGAVGIDSLLGPILNLERRHWARVVNGMHADREYDLRRGVAQVTAIGGAPSAPVAEALLMADGFYKREAPEQVRTPLADLKRVYGAPGGEVAALEPDLVGEHEICQTADDRLIEGCFAWIGTLPEDLRPTRRRTLLTVLQRATQPEHGVSAAGEAKARLETVVRHHLAKAATGIVAVLIGTPGQLGGVLLNIVPVLDDAALAPLDEALPLQSLALMEIALAVTGRASCLWLAFGLRRRTQSDFSYINYNPGDVPSTMVAANAECMIDFSYGSQTLQVAYITNATRTIKFTDFVGDGFGGEAGTRNGSGGIQWIPDIQTYRIYNTAEGMAQPGQFYWDKTANIVYYFPLPGKSPNSSTIIVPTTNRIFFYSGYGNIHPGGSGASPFTLSNLTLQVNAVNVEPEGNFGYLWDHESLFAIETQAGGTGLSFLNCTMGSCGGNAIGADFGFVSNVNILNCTISNCGGYGVAMRMAGPVVVSNNYIHDCGLISWQSPGVRVNTNALVTQNNLFNFHTSAIADHDVDNCVFSLNSISNCMFTEEDMGAYYQYFGSYTTLAHPHGNVIISNLFQSVGTNYNVSGGDPVPTSSVRRSISTSNPRILLSLPTRPSDAPPLHSLTWLFSTPSPIT